MSSDYDMTRNILDPSDTPFCPRCYSGALDQRITKPEDGSAWSIFVQCKRCGHSTCLRYNGVMQRSIPTYQR